MEKDVESCVQALICAIRASEAYQNYKLWERELDSQPELWESVDGFRRRVFQVSTSEQEDLYEEVDRLEEESVELRLNPTVNAFLAAELEMCRLLREVAGRLNDEVGVRLPE